MKKLLLVFMILASSDAMADQMSREKHELRMVQLKLQSVLHERDSLSGQVEDLKKQVESLKSDSSSEKAKSDGRIAELQREVSKQKKEIADLSQQNQETRERLQVETGKSSDIKGSLDQVLDQDGQERKKLDAALSGKTGELASCEKKNMDLYRLDVSLMQKYDNKGVWSALVQKEPFTQIEEVRIENLLQEYRDKADADRISKAR
ncbi:MAG TPA: hypothetical protein PLK99_06045 [Burkholderiales bacterium]|nr:hypothetical protein [Burkholderiales bacterium]